MLAGITALGFAAFGLSGIAAAQSVSTASAGIPPGQSTGTTVDPLQYNCGDNAPECGHVGESNAYFQGTPVDLLYTENYYCDANVPSKASTGCEVGAGPSKTPSGTSSGGTGTSLGNTTHGDTLYIPVPLFADPPSTQCPAGTTTVTCIDHPSTVDLSALAPDLGVSNASTLDNVPIPAHNHVVATRNNGLPEWWNVEVVATKSASTFASLTSLNGINAALTAKTAVEAPSNIFLFFQVLPGTESPAMAANNAAAEAPGQGYSNAPPSSSHDQTESGATFNNLKVDCEGNGTNCENVGIAHGYVDGSPGQGIGQGVQLLYSENYDCPAPNGGNTPASSSGCEAGAPAKTIPAGVGGNGVVPTAANSAPGATDGSDQIDPLYIPVPLGFTPQYTQCPTVVSCIDHPMTIDLSNIASALGVPASAVKNVPLPSHDHVMRTRNGDQPEWWNVEVVPVTSQAQLDAVQNSKNLTAAQEMPFGKSNPGGSIDTNVYLWFQSLPGGDVTTPGPVYGTTTGLPNPALVGSCSTNLPAGSVVAGADLPDGSGYVETDAAGDVFVSGGEPCYGSLTGVHINKPIVGIAIDRQTGGYWLVASDGGIFNFNAPFYGSTGAVTLNKPIVGMTTNLNSTGYILVASDGGVFPFDMPFEGSLGGTPLNKPIVGIAYDPATPAGYYMVASDGGVFDFGGAVFHGSLGDTVLNKPIVAIDPLLNGTGYRMIASDGGTFQEGDAPIIGSLGNVHLNYPIIAAGADFSSDGFTDFAADGGVFPFGSAFYGSAA